MTLIQALSQARQIIAASNAIEDIPLVCELLLRHALKISRAQLYLDLDHNLTPEQEETFWQLVKRTLHGEPVAYITGHREFFGLDFYVDQRVLIPRPESELLVETAINLAKSHVTSSIADIGTGCGAIAISLALELPQARIYATDISAPALEVALLNCKKHGVENMVRLLKGNMLDPLPEPVDIIVANLPYVKDSELHPNNPISFEPRLALSGGMDGLNKIRELCRQINDNLRPSGHLLLEIGVGQARGVTDLLHGLFSSGEIEVKKDLNGIDRVVCLAPSVTADSETKVMPLIQPFPCRHNLLGKRSQ